MIHTIVDCKIHYVAAFLPCVNDHNACNVQVIKEHINIIK